MRIVSLIPAAGLALVALTALPDGAEAKGRRAFGGVWTAAHASISAKAAAPVAALSASEPVLRGTQATGATAEAKPAPLPEASPPVAKPVIREAVASGSWCATGRVFGSGAGFCEIN